MSRTRWAIAWALLGVGTLLACAACAGLTDALGGAAPAPVAGTPLQQGLATAGEVAKEVGSSTGLWPVSLVGSVLSFLGSWGVARGAARNAVATEQAKDFNAEEIRDIVEDIAASPTHLDTLVSAIAGNRRLVQMLADALRDYLASPPPKTVAG